MIMDTIIVIDPQTNEQFIFELTDEDFIAAYVPEAGYCEMDFEETFKLAKERSEAPALEFESSVKMAT